MMMMNTLAELNCIKTIKMQYSNIGIKSLFMLSNPSILMSFSNFYISLFSNVQHNVGPKRCFEAGYPAIISTNEVSAKGISLRKGLQSSGADFVIGYFDERIDEDNDIWAWKKKSDHLKEIHALCEYVLKNKNVGIIVKTQFVRNNPLKRYKGDRLLFEAYSTGRMIFPEIGHKRNLILPTQIALASDVCIGDCVGATASLEVALHGTRSLMIDSMNIGKKYRPIYYEEKHVMMHSITKALYAIDEFRGNSNGNSKLGDWTAILQKIKIVNDNVTANADQLLSTVLHGSY
jgi:hypothetical protein